MALNFLPDVTIGRDAGWILAFHTETDDGIVPVPVLEISRNDYFAEIRASLPGGLEGGSYQFVIEGLTDDDYAKITRAQATPPRIVRLYLYYRDLEPGDFGILSNVMGSDFINSGSMVKKHEADLVAELHVSSVTRKAGSRKYETTVTAIELVYQLMNSRRACGQPIEVTDADSAVKELMKRASPWQSVGVPYKYYAPTPRKDPPPDAQDQKDQTTDYIDGRETVLTGLLRIVTGLEQKSNQFGRGMLLIRNGTVYVGQRPIPLDPNAKAPKALTFAQGLLEVETLESVTTDPNWVPCSGKNSPTPRSQFRLTLRGRPDLKPGDLVAISPPKEDSSTAVSPLAGALGALGDLGAAAVGDVMGLISGTALKDPIVQLYVTSVDHVLGRSQGFVTTVIAVQVAKSNPVPTTDDALWDGHTAAEAGIRQEPTQNRPSRGTAADEAADAVVRMVRREIASTKGTDIAEVRVFRAQPSGSYAEQTSDVIRGLAPMRSRNVSRRADVLRPSQAPANGVPYLTPFAWGKCGLVLPRYPGMRVAVMHRNFDDFDPIDLGAVWQTGHAPTNANDGDWWLAMPAEDPTGNAPAQDKSGAPEDYSGKVSQDLIDANGNRMIELSALVIRIGTDELKSAGTRPPNPPKGNSVTIEHSSGAKIQIDDQGNITIEAKQTLTLKASKVDVQCDSMEVH